MKRMIWLLQPGMSFRINSSPLSISKTMKKIHFIIHSYFILFLLVQLTGCNKPKGEETNPTLGVTQAYQTVEAHLTQAAAQTPAATQLPSPTVIATTETPTSNEATPTATSKASITPTATTSVCDQAAAGSPIDVTIPDDTTMQPGQAFTKTWRLQNTGTCTWTKDYSIALFSGEALNSSGSVTLPQKVDPGQSVDISVDMTAPLTPGTYQGNWKLLNASSTWFGIGPGGGSPFWVRIIVSQDLTVTMTSSPTPVTPYPPVSTATTTTPPGSAIALVPGDVIDLDALLINPGAGGDIIYEANSAGKLALAPLSSAGFSIFGSSTPTLENCQAIPLDEKSLVVKNQGAGIFLCYRTDQGNFGWLRLLNWDPKGHTLIVQASTWTLP
jgi:hypothetical protein